MHLDVRRPKCVLLLSISWLFHLATAIPDMIRPHTPGFVYKSHKIALAEPINDVASGYGDAVCSKYYAEYFKEYDKFRWRVFNEDNVAKGHIPEYHKPYTLYPRPDLPEWPVPVEAILGEVYESIEGGKPTGVVGCYVACQDIRKTLEWILATRRSRKLQFRVKAFFSFRCGNGMSARRTYRQSWREKETQAEIIEAFNLLRTFSISAQYNRLKPRNRNMVLNGEPDVITGCECYEATEEERMIDLGNILKARYREGSTTLVMNAKRAPVKHNGRQIAAEKRKASDQAESSARKSRRADPSEANTSTESDKVENEAVDEIDDTFYFTEDGIFLDEEVLDPQDDLNASRSMCHDYEYPTFEVGQAEPAPEVVDYATGLLRASLAFADFDDWLDLTPIVNSNHKRQEP